MNNDTEKLSKGYWVDLLHSETYLLRGRYQSRILTAGNPEKPALILLHGTGGHLENYARNIPTLSKSFYVIALDFVWHGRSQTTDFNLDIIPTLADQVINVLDQLGIANAFLEGQSLGGWVAMYTALHFPKRINALVLTTTMGFKPDPLSIPGYVEPDWTANLPTSIEVLNNPSFANVHKRMARILANPERLTDEAVLVRQALYQQPALAEVQKSFITEYLSGNTITQYQITEQMAAAIKQPCLVYWGDQNRTPPAYGQFLAHCLANGQFYCAANTGHWAQFESAPEHDQVVTQFLQKIQIESTQGITND